MKRILLMLLLPLCAHANLNSELIIDKLSGGKGFEFKFEQKNYYKFLKQPKVSNGKAVYNVPSCFIWELFGDNAVKIVNNGKKLWIYSPPEEEGDIPTLSVRDPNKDKGIQSLILDLEQKISMLKDSKTKKGLKELYIKGNREKGYSWARVNFDDRTDFRLDSIEFEDIDGSKVLIEVRDFKRLPKKLAGKEFIFKAPKGTRIIQ